MVESRAPSQVLSRKCVLTVLLSRFHVCYSFTEFTIACCKAWDWGSPCQIILASIYTNDIPAMLQYVVHLLNNCVRFVHCSMISLQPLNRHFNFIFKSLRLSDSQQNVFSGSGKYFRNRIQQAGIRRNFLNCLSTTVIYSRILTLFLFSTYGNNIRIFLHHKSLEYADDVVCRAIPSSRISKFQ